MGSERARQMASSRGRAERIGESEKGLCNGKMTLILRFDPSNGMLEVSRGGEDGRGVDGRVVGPSKLSRCRVFKASRTWRKHPSAENL